MLRHESDGGYVNHGAMLDAVHSSYSTISNCGRGVRMGCDLAAKAVCLIANGSHLFTCHLSIRRQGIGIGANASTCDELNTSAPL